MMPNARLSATLWTRSIKNSASIRFIWEVCTAWATPPRRAFRFSACRNWRIFEISEDAGIQPGDELNSRDYLPDKIFVVCQKQIGSSSGCTSEMNCIDGRYSYSGSDVRIQICRL